MPSIRFQDGATLRDITDIRYQDGATLRTITAVYYQDGATLRKVWPSIPPLTASASPTSLSAAGRGNKNTSTCTCTASGGSGTKTYKWERVSGDTAITAALSTSASTAFRAYLAPGDHFYGTWRCKVTDSSGTTYSNNVSLKFKYL